MAYTDTWNSAFEAVPAATDLVSSGDENIRAFKVAIRERIAKDHYMSISGTDADHGEHVKVTLRTGSAPTAVADKGILYGKDVSSKIQLFFMDEDGNETQLTSAGTAAGGVATGTIQPWPVSTVPSGYLECNGASVLKASYAALYSILCDGGASCIYGEADSTHFYLPDYRGYFLRGWAHGTTVDPDKASRTNRGDTVTGDYVGTKQVDVCEMPTHTHTSSASGSYNAVIAGSGIAAGSGYGITAMTGFSTGNNSTTGGNETRPTNINVMYIIKT